MRFNEISSPEEIAKYLIYKFKELGFRVLYYKSRSSKSCYLKLDGGVAYSLRISDHWSYKNHLVYKFSLNTQYTGHKIKLVNYKRQYIYGPDHVKKLIGDINIERKIQRMKLGDYKYEKFIHNAISKCAQHKSLKVFKEV